LSLILLTYKRITRLSHVSDALIRK